MKESNANMRFKKSKRSAYRSRRSPQLTPGLSQATLVEGRDEDFHSVDSVHFPTVCNLISQQCRQSLYRSRETPDAVVRIKDYSKYRATAGWARHQSSSGSAL